MFRFLDSISNVTSYEIHDKLIYQTRGRGSEASLFYDDQFISSNVCSFVKDLKSEVVFYTWDLNVYKKVGSSLKLLLTDFSINENVYEEKTIFVSKKISAGNYIKSLYNIEKEEFIKDVKEVPWIVTDSLELYYSGTVVKMVSRLNGSNGWETELGGRKYLKLGKEKDVEIQRLIGMEAGQVLLFLSNIELISLDIETGAILWETKDFVKNNLPAYRDYRMGTSIFNYGILENGKLYQLHGNIYYSIDLHTQEVDILWEDKSEKEYITCQYAGYTDDYVYFTGSRNNRFSPYLLGAFNRKTMQLDWVHQPEGLVNPLTNVPKYVDGKLYILDSGGILHIYERN